MQYTDHYQHRQNLGSAGEDQAVQFYISRGGRLLGRNVRYPCGEIDLIVEIDGQVVFVEVKTRSSADFGGAESITPAKFMRMRRAAAQWLAGGPLRSVRFDALVIDHSALDPVIHYEGIECGAC